MKCMFCKNPATVHLTDIVNKKKREAHLCEKCARERNLLPDQPGPQIDLKALVSLMMSQADPAAKPSAAPPACPACGLSYAAFKAAGRFGCPNDYDAFKADLLPLMESVHGEVRHAGKTPRRAPRTKTAQAELAQLRQQLQTLVNEENYEEAARVRDRIKDLETS